MNIGIYRLVFNAARGLWMVVSEHVISHQAGATSSRVARRAQARAKLKAQSGMASINIFFAGLLLGTQPLIGVADPQLPATHIPDASQFNVTHGEITHHLPNAATLNINQSTQKAIIETPSFNIGSQGTVNFNHVYTGEGKAGTLVRINGDRSIIEGALNSPNGSIHLINQNGILFANGAKVNVNGLVASALNLSNSDFLSQFGHLNAATEQDVRAAYIWEGDYKDFKEVLVQIEPNAEIKAALGSAVMVFAPKVINQGSIDAADGQVVMAAGEKVYLSFAPELNLPGASSFNSYQPDSPYNALSGVLVEVDSYKTTTQDVTDAQEIDPLAEVPTEVHGEVTNDVSGDIFSQRGNVTLAGYMVNQKGRITATSSVSQRGSIRLLARDGGDNGVTKGGGVANYIQDQGGTIVVNQGLPNGVDDTTITGNRTGELTIGDGSVTAVLPEDEAALQKVDEIFPVEDNYTNKIVDALKTPVDEAGNEIERPTIADSQTFTPNLIEAIGSRVYIGDDAKIINPAGIVDITARRTSFAPALNTFDESARLYLGENSLIDASGLQGVALDMESNFIEILLTQLDLKNNPVNKDSFIYRTKVWLDVRNAPDDRVADVSGFVEQFGRTLGEKHATGGTVNLKTTGSMVQSAGATVDISGGSIQYNAGLNKETWLVDSSNRAYAFGEAPTDVEFIGFVGDKNSIDRVEAAYVEGKSAGEVNIETNQLVMDGQVKGSAIYGEKQRDAANLGGQLNITLFEGAKSQNVSIGDIEVRDRSVNADIADTNNDGVLDALNDNTESIHYTANSFLTDEEQVNFNVSADMLNSSGLESINLDVNGDVIVDQSLQLADGANLALEGATVMVNSNIKAEGGHFTFTASERSNQSNNENNSIQVADNVDIDVTGKWTNDQLESSLNRFMQDGGSVTFKADDQVSLGHGSLVDASAGARIKANGDVVAGDAGSIAIEPLQGQDGFPGKPYTFEAPELNGELRAYAVSYGANVRGQGGHLNITAPFVTIGSESFGDSRELHLTSEFFQQGGFTTYRLTGRDGVVVRSDADVSVVSQNYTLDSNFSTQATGSNLADFTSVSLLPEYQQSSTSIALKTVENPNNEAVLAGFSESGVGQGGITVETGAAIAVASHGQLDNAQGESVAPSISLDVYNSQLSVDGTLKALGGDINLTFNDLAGDDRGYDAEQAIWLGSHADLLVHGYTELQPNAFNLRVGEIYDAGSININAVKGFVVAESGAVMDVSGAESIFDIRALNGQYLPTSISSNAGSVSISAREGMLLDNTFNAAAVGDGLGGELTVRLTNDGTNSFVTSTSGLPAYPAGDRTIEVSQSNQNVPNGLSEGDDLESVTGRVAKLSADDIMRGGFSTVNLASQDYVSFKGDVSLETNRSITVNSRQISADDDAKVVLTSGIVNLSNSNDLDTGLRNVGGLTNASGKATASVGSATLDVVANLVDLEGDVALSGFDQTHINSAGDIRLKGVTYRQGTTPVRPRGQLTTLGDLTLSAQQIYPTTFTDYKLQADGRTVTINSQAGQRSTVLSAQSQLTIQADAIEQNGVLKAPFGSITLDANTIDLKAGSLTSVSADGALIPFGVTQGDGANYSYQVGQFVQQYKRTEDTVIIGSGALNVDDLADRQINLNANEVNQHADSQIDLSGGGDLLAYEWVKGIGGNNDILANNVSPQVFGQNAEQTWAILPANNATFANVDQSYWQGSDLNVGDAVYLSEVPGLAAGYYTLMPARYGLLPDAKLVTAVNDAQDMPTGLTQVLQDGGVMTSGYTASYTSDGYVQTSRQAGFVVRDASYIDNAAEYKETLASDYFQNNNIIQQTADAGRLSIQATNQLVLNGLVNTQAASGGSGADVDLSATNLLIVAAGEQQGEVVKDGKTYLAVSEESLQNLNAASLLLGGKREQGTLTVGASEVRVDSNATVQGSEVILSGKDTVQLDAGATISGVGTSAAARDLTVTDASQDGDSAILRVAGVSKADYERQNANADRGELIVSTGSTIEADGSVLLDASKKITLDGELSLSEGASLTLGSNRISLGDPDNGDRVLDGLALGAAQLSQISDASDLTLKSQSTIDLYGNVSIGNETAEITFDSAGVGGYQNAGETVNITADTVTFNNQNNVAFVEAPALSSTEVPVLGDGTLNISANTVQTGDHTVRIAGFNQVDLTAKQQVSIQGSGATANALEVDNHLNIATSLLTANAGANAEINATGLLSVSGIEATGEMDVSASSGANVQLNGQQVRIAGEDINQPAANIVLQGGQLGISATGDQANDNVVVGSGANIDVSGREYSLYDTTVDLPAGGIALTAENGSIDLQQDAQLNLKASGDGSAGRLTITAENGNVNIEADISSGQKGELELDAKSVDFRQVSTALNEFSGVQTYRVREGDVQVESSQGLVAETVNIEVDQGAITINGTIDASGEQGGNIGLYANNDVVISDGAQLLAIGVADKTTNLGTLGDGGHVTLSSKNGMIGIAAPNASAQGGALIDVSGDLLGDQVGRGGTVTLRVSADDVTNISTQSTAAILGARENGVNIAPVNKQSSSTFGETQLAAVEATLTTVKSNFENVNYAVSRDGVNATITPEALIYSDGDLNVADKLVLTNQYTLALQADGDLKVNGSIDALGSQGGNIRLVAGHDGQSAHPETTIDGAGDIVLTSPAAGFFQPQTPSFIRTDSGFISLAAGGNVDLSNNNRGSAIYSKGLESADPADFVRLPDSLKLSEYYGQYGGDVSVVAGGSVVGSNTLANSQSTQSWLVTAINGKTGTDDRFNKQIRWWVQDEAISSSGFGSFGAVNTNTLKGFTNGIGTLGGGDVVVKAGSDIKDIQVAAATSGRMGGDENQNPDINQFIEVGGGDAQVIAKGAVQNVLLQTSYGQATVDAVDQIDVNLSLMQADALLRSGANININDVNNTTALRPAFNSGFAGLPYNHAFYTYGERSAINALSTAGDVSLAGSGKALPSNVTLYSPEGSINLGDIASNNYTLALFPSSQSTLELAAGENLNVSRVLMSDLDVDRIPSILTAEQVVLSTVGFRSTLANVSGLLETTGLNAHSALTEEIGTPVKLYAGQDVNFVTTITGEEAKLTTNQLAEIRAGNDVLNPNVSIQNRAGQDVSIIEAGRDIKFNEPKSSGNTLLSLPRRIEINGPGRLHVIAGRDVDLQAAEGILSVGNSNNPFLSAEGADILVQAGATSATDYDAVIARYVAPGADYSSIYLPQLGDFMRERTGDNSLTSEQALAAFSGLDKQEQTEFINQIFFAEINAGGREAADPDSQYGLDDYTRSERMILTMFPEFTDNADAIPVDGSTSSAFEAIKNEVISHPGDLKLFYSQIKSERGGDVELLIPGGFVNAGLAVSSGLVKRDSDLGIVTLRGGDINTFVRDDLQVNQSRIFTLGGSDMLLYSALADIDAGKGEKTASATPPPAIRIVNGQVVLDYSAAVSGSGIAALTSTGGDAGDVVLYAPYGTINAGEAGIRSTGDVFIGARIVVGADNISAGGTTSGVPVSTGGFSVVAPASANPANAGQDNESVSESANESLSQKVAELPSIISVEVLSLGDGSAPTNVNCDAANKQSGQCED